MKSKFYKKAFGPTTKPLKNCTLINFCVRVGRVEKVQRPNGKIFSALLLIEDTT